MTTALRSRASSRLLRTQPRQRGRGNATAAALATPLEPHQTPGWGHTGHAAGATPGTPPGPLTGPHRPRQHSCCPEQSCAVETWGTSTSTGRDRDRGSNPPDSHHTQTQLSLCCFSHSEKLLDKHSLWFLQTHGDLDCLWDKSSPSTDGSNGFQPVHCSQKQAFFPRIS